MFIKLKNKKNQSIYFEGHICDKLPLKNEVDKHKIQDCGYLRENWEGRSSP